MENIPRLLVTAVKDCCYITLTQALHLIMEIMSEGFTETSFFGQKVQYALQIEQKTFIKALRSLRH